MSKFNWPIIKGYDIRGVFEAELTKNDISLIGLAIGSWIHQNFSNNRKIVIGYDNRSSSQEIFHILSKVLHQFDINIYNINLSSSPILSFATINLNCCGIMITASHNHIDCNGMKISKPNAGGMDGDDIKNIVEDFFLYNNHIDYNICSYENSKIININVFDEYISFLFLHLKITKKHFFQKTSKKKIAFDFLGSTMEQFAQSFFYNQENCFFIQNRQLIDKPDPTLAENLLNLRSFIKKAKCDFGFAFDGDCDRITALDENGDIIQIEHLAMILSVAIGGKGKKIVHDVRCSSKLNKFLHQELDFQSYQSKIGHSIIKKTMKEFDADLSCETSGHFIFKELTFDDGFYVALFLMNYLSSEENNNLKLSETIKNLPEIYCSENIKISLQNQEITKKLNSIIKKAYSQKKTVELFDGVKIIDDDGWIFFRQSRTEECLTIKFEAYEKENFDKKKIDMENFLAL